jgi:hypothetical protein
MSQVVRIHIVGDADERGLSGDVIVDPCHDCSSPRVVEASTSVGKIKRSGLHPVAVTRGWLLPLLEVQSARLEIPWRPPSRDRRKRAIYLLSVERATRSHSFILACLDTLGKNYERSGTPGCRGRSENVHVWALCARAQDRALGTL